jgi:hypothetical protein
LRVVIAGNEIERPLEYVRTYLRKKEKTVRNYDLYEQEDANTLTSRDILATQYIESRIDGMQLQSLLDLGRTAPWRDVRADATLAEADPEVEGGLYDDAEELYRHFYTGRRRGTSVGKLHKVVHLKRPALYPLFGGRLKAIYTDMAKEMSRRSEARRGRRGRLYWAAIREDLLSAGDAWDELRTRLADLPEPESLGARLTDVRLHDILCWQLAPGPLR